MHKIFFMLWLSLPFRLWGQAEYPLNVDFHFPLPATATARETGLQTVRIYRQEALEAPENVEASAGAAKRSFVLVRDNRQLWAIAQYDPAGRLLSVESTADNPYNDPVGSFTFSAGYDPLGRRVREVIRRSNEMGIPVHLDSTWVVFSPDLARDSLFTRSGEADLQNPGPMNWKTSLRVLHRDDAGKLVLETHFIPSGEGIPAWEQVSAIHYTYDESDRLARREVEKQYVRENFDQPVLTAYHYDPSGKLIETVGRDCEACRINYRSLWQYGPSGEPVHYGERRLKISVDAGAWSLKYGSNLLPQSFIRAPDSTDIADFDYEFRD